MTRDRTCAERIEEQLASRIEDFVALDKRAASDDEDARDAAYEEMSELPLSVERITVVKVLLSTGGPADWFEYHLDAENDVTRIEYHFQDWFDHASTVLDGEAFTQAEQLGRHITADFYHE